MTNETIADIVAEMRNHASGSAESAWYTPETWRQLCDRIEAAENELTKQRDDYYKLWAEKVIENGRLKSELRAETAKAHIGYEAIKEVERPRAALKPVMECDCKVLASRQFGDSRFTMCDDEFVKLCKVTEAVRAAQEIMKGENHD